MDHRGRDDCARPRGELLPLPLPNTTTTSLHWSARDRQPKQGRPKGGTIEDALTGDWWQLDLVATKAAVESGSAFFDFSLDIWRPRVSDGRCRAGVPNLGERTLAALTGHRGAPSSRRGRPSFDRGAGLTVVTLGGAAPNKGVATVLGADS